MPKHRNLDTICLEWDYGTYCDVEKYGVVEVKHFWDQKVEYVGGYASRSGKTSFSEDVSYISSKKSLKNNQYTIREEYLCAAIKLHEDYEGYSSATMEEIYTTFNNEGISFKLYIKPKRNTEKVKFILEYLHTKVNYDMSSVILPFLTLDSGSAANIGRALLEATYVLASGNNKTVSQVISGVDHTFIFNCK